MYIPTWSGDIWYDMWNVGKQQITDMDLTTHTIRVWYINLHLPYVTIKNQPNVGKYAIHGWYG